MLLYAVLDVALVRTFTSPTLGIWEGNQVHGTLVCIFESQVNVLRWFYSSVALSHNILYEPRVHKYVVGLTKKGLHRPWC